MGIPNVSELTELFKQSAGNEALPTSERALAAQCALLAGHIRRVERKNDKLIAELAGIIEQRTQAPKQETPPEIPVTAATAQVPVEAPAEIDPVEAELAKGIQQVTMDRDAKIEAAYAKAAAKNAAKTQSAENPS
jgi:hypothetical protein